MTKRSPRPRPAKRADARLREDVTETWAIEDQRQETRPLQAIGRLAGGLAHDFNNLSRSCPNR